MPRIILCLIILLASTHPVNASESQHIEAIEVYSENEQVDENIALYLKKYQSKVFSHRQEKAMAADVRLALQALGYYEFSIDIEFSSHSQQLKVHVELAPAFKWHTIDVRIQGDANHDQVLQRLLKSLPIKVGGVLRHDAYSSAKSQIESTLLERGYFDFTWQKSRLEVNQTSKHAAAKLYLESGPRYKFGELKLSGGSKATRFIVELATFDQNTNYDAKKLSDYSIALNETPYFANVTVYPLLKERQLGKVPVRVDVTDKPANSFEIGGGYSTELDAKFRLKWKKPWVNQFGHSFETDLNLSERKQDITGAYTIPVGDPNDDLWRVLSGYQLQDDLTEGVKLTTWNVQLQRQRVFESGWVRTAFLKREHEKSEQTGLLLDTEMLLPGVSYARKRSKGGMTPSWGSEQLLTLEVAHESVISSTSLAKIHWKQAWLRTYKARHLALLRAELGALVAKEFDKTPLNMRFFAGGDQSIRGFAFQSISPRGPQGERLGAKYLVAASAEYNYQFLPNWRAAIFVDAGTATNDFEEKWSVGAGFGFRYLTPFGPVRVDHAWGLSKPSKSTRLSIVIGPEI
ncbi:autotransporter assembly complex protein TamA [Pseudoalteromonas luteoviolacea]|uniref:Translocation and assembly module subunit TamA n=1 Tax=Pseudoalteromonas luteoviolacea S4054 TaxID=1129367 RepID=A0A0F6A4Z6_9GAMM|nr:autotransporter assembly complex family protein [Pseudoalteromonas luteoviolacea]AOT09491.1 hypothetical protein S4054249_17290 [Pseudoalteromonas luteoviolacea]AOT14403.1 hypothetical protein S40542_17260 [Pseudoalteromonas luteoviolacea]AOT19319.1 hypothetical protein S4054_17265 [Pseudoalteromonas luteoviolacea]KKE80936.1 hypothetical protein N479_24265 [Pseudoalteromonas luteoviolacea S4054]KZN65288.1 hypothetical protein N481_02515 [Pseudoalteromonas luteoviolacea S4047-1]